MLIRIDSKHTIESTQVFFCLFVYPSVSLSVILSVCHYYRYHNSSHHYHNDHHDENNYYFLLYKTDPGEVKGTKLRILKYPHPKVRCTWHIIYRYKIRSFTTTSLLRQLNLSYCDRLLYIGMYQVFSHQIRLQSD